MIFTRPDMDSAYLEVDEIITDEIVDNKLVFAVWIVKPAPFVIRLPFEKLPSPDLVSHFCVRIINHNKQRNVDNMCDRIYELLSLCKKNELDSLVVEFRTIVGLELPCSQQDEIRQRLKTVIRTSHTNYEEITNIRRDILVEKILSERELQLVNMKRAEIQINVISDCAKYIKVTNDYDLEQFPSHLIYVNHYISSLKDIPLEATVGCDCENKCSVSCSHLDFEREFQPKNSAKDKSNKVEPYDENGRILISPHKPVFECNKFCKCSEDCPRRVVQKGGKVQLEIFRSFTGCGWGVRTMEFIPKGTYISKYAAEIIPWEEPDNQNRNCEYLFDIALDFDQNVGHGTYTFDAYKYGNVSRFINHSCSPNLDIHTVFINNIHCEMAEIVFFSKKNIDRNEEITIDYKDLVKSNGIQCRCATCQDE